MTIQAGVTVDGTRRLRGNLVHVRRNYPREVVTPGLKAAADVGLRYLLFNRDYDNRTWALRRSSGVQQTRTRTGQFNPGYGLVSGGRGAPYAVYVNHLRRYFRNALERMRRVAPAILLREARRRHRRFRVPHR